MSRSLPPVKASSLLFSRAWPRTRRDTRFGAMRHRRGTYLGSCCRRQETTCDRTSSQRNVHAGVSTRATDQREFPIAPNTFVRVYLTPAIEERTVHVYLFIRDLPTLEATATRVRVQSLRNVQYSTGSSDVSTLEHKFRRVTEEGNGVSHATVSVAPLGPDVSHRGIPKLFNYTRIWPGNSRFKVCSRYLSRIEKLVVACPGIFRRLFLE